MKLNFRSYKRKLFGSSPGRRKSRIRVKSETAKYLRLISTFLIVALILSISPTVFGADFIKTTRKKTTTTTTTQTVAPSEPGKMTLKAGTYRFNDVLDVSTNFEQDITLTSYVESDDVLTTSTSIKCENNYLLTFITTLQIGEEIHTLNSYEVLYDSGSYDGASQVWTIPSDTTVDDTFGTWYIANTNYNEVNGITESVLGLRRFKKEIDVSLSPVNDENFYLDIEGVYLPNEAEPLPFTKIQLNNADLTDLGASTTTQQLLLCDESGCMAIYQNGWAGSEILEHCWLFSMDGSMTEDEARLVNITKCDDETAKAWLLANTDPVTD